MQRLRVKGIVTNKDKDYILMLENSKKLALPIIINEFDAHAISLSCEGIKLETPLLYDVMKGVLNKVGCKLERVIISNVIDGIFYTEIEFSHNDEKFSFAGRLSDAVVLAISNNAPILINPELEGYFEDLQVSDRIVRSHKPHA